MNFNKSTLLVLISVAILGCAKVDDGVKAYNSQNYAEALKILSPLAKKGDAKAQEYIGLMYGKGLGVPESEQEAFKWFKLAADQGNPDAQASLANMYFSGAATSRNDAEGMRLLKLAANQKNDYAEYRLGQIYQDGISVPQDYFEALKWYKLSSEHGNSNAQYSIGLMYMFGYGVNESFDEAYKWFKQSAEQKNMYAQNALGNFYENGWVVDRNLKEAERLYMESAMQGFDGAKKNLANLKNLKPEEWTKVSYSGDGMVTMVKMPSKVVISDPLIKSIWVKFINKDKSYTMTHDEYECNKQMYRVMLQLNYGSDGKVFSKVNSPTAWSPVIPNAPVDSIYKRACKN